MFNRNIAVGLYSKKVATLPKQYLPKKPVKRGFKVWVRADGVNGYARGVHKKKQMEKGS